MAKFQEGQKVKFVGNPEDHGRIDSDLKVGDTFVIQEATRGCKRDLYRYGVYWYNNNELKPLNNQSDMSNFQPFYVEIEGDNHGRMLQKIAFEEGFSFGGSGGKGIKNPIGEYIGFVGKGNKQIWFHPFTDNREKLEDYTLDEFRQALRGEYFENEPIEIGRYKVEFLDSYNKIQVGCIEYRNFQFKNLYDRLCAVKSRCKGNLNISLNHPDVGEIPFEKIEAIYNRITS